MPSDNTLGEIVVRARGKVVRGEDIERTLALVPEQVWAWDEDITLPGGTVLSDITIPMAKRREIIAMVLGSLVE